METSAKATLTCQTEINAPIENVWELWTTPEHIMQWNNTNEDWHTPEAENDLRPGGKLRYEMALKNGSESFVHSATYDEIITNELIRYTDDTGRKSTVVFSGSNPVKLTETFEPEPSLPTEMQQNFCQGILNTFKKYAESIV